MSGKQQPTCLDCQHHRSHQCSWCSDSLILGDGSGRALAHHGRRPKTEGGRYRSKRNHGGKNQEDGSLVG